ncbi:MAG: LytTR family DNA-binding domain-containing protein [Solobacterium sp.]|jgi:DNA-binding LytR/AlgR family response regulator|nr:LytTR family DNA-binding domain-containing protein [Solobacterium sp.]MCH4048964.1 LytTR family DNA-binding domain-containing protein [Solobacterium sp.]MCH4074282.1 LytTR family DNA-binding domain-containing protein [Solobacterium sp.]
MRVDIVLLDDSKEDMENIERSLRQKMPGFELVFHKFTDPEDPDLYRKKADLYLLDIDMKSVSGIDTAEKLEKNFQHVRIIFVSWRDDLVFETFRVSTLYFIRKKKLDQDMTGACVKLKSIFEDEKAELILMHGMNRTVVLAGDISYIEVRHNNVEIHTEQGVMTERLSIHAILEQLPSAQFVQTHQSYAVNLSKIKCTEHDYVLLRTGERIPVSKSRSKETRMAYIQYISRKG